MSVEKRANIKEGKVLVAAHRGMGVTEKPRDEYLGKAKFYPENSIAAFRKALDDEDGAGATADVIEFDIHVSKDGEAMVIHGPDLLKPYADYIGTGEKALNGPSKKFSPKVHDYTVEELKRLFTLKSHDIIMSDGRVFDKLSDDEKLALSERDKTCVLQMKRDLLRDEPEMHSIPTFKELLRFAFEKNKKRHEEGKPLVKLNIELKGDKSAIPAIAAIMEFYKENPEAKEFVRPEDMIFLGRGEVGEIVIAKALLKGQFDIDAVVDEIKKYKKEDYISEHRSSLEEQYKDKRQKNYKSIYKNIYTNALQGINPEIKVSKNREFLESLESLEKYIDYTTEKEFEKLNLKQRIIEQLQFNAPKLLNKEDMSKELEGEKLPVISGERISAELSAAKTNFMISTGQLYGEDRIANTGNFDLEPDTVNISAKGYKKIIDVFRRGYSGIDIGLFDYCGGVAEAVRDAVAELGIEDKSSLILGASATSWKASKLESAPVRPLTAVLIANSFAKNLGMDLLLKVDEPRIFRGLLNSVESLYGEDVTYGEVVDVSKYFFEEESINHNYGEAYNDSPERRYDASDKPDLNSGFAGYDSDDEVGPVRKRITFDDTVLCGKVLEEDIDGFEFTGVSRIECKENGYDSAPEDDKDIKHISHFLSEIIGESSVSEDASFLASKENTPKKTNWQERVKRQKETGKESNPNFSVNGIDISPIRAKPSDISLTGFTPTQARPVRRHTPSANRKPISATPIVISGEIRGYVYSARIGQQEVMLHNSYLDNSIMQDEIEGQYNSIVTELSRHLPHNKHVNSFASRVSSSSGTPISVF